MSSVKKVCICSICIALCCVLPAAFHAVALGAAFSPLHLPVLLCGLLCGWPYGAFCGIAGPVLSCLVTGMPSAVRLIYMVPELCAYGLFSGFLFHVIRTGRWYLPCFWGGLPAARPGRCSASTTRRDIPWHCGPGPIW